MSPEAESLIAVAIGSETSARALRATIPAGVTVTEDAAQSRAERLARHHDARARLYRRAAVTTERVTGEDDRERLPAR